MLYCNISNSIVLEDDPPVFFSFLCSCSAISPADCDEPSAGTNGGLANGGLVTKKCEASHFFVKGKCFVSKFHIFFAKRYFA